MSWTDDPAQDAENYFAEAERRMERFPVCDNCGYRITGEYRWRINGKLWCEDCINDFRELNDIE